jgi:methionyl-tRNA formyltransferase
MMQDIKNYVVATIRRWNLKEFEANLANIPGNWYLITEVEKLTIEYLKGINPRYIFFPHWSHKVSANIFQTYDCVCFHETDLPFGRGGSPLQNLILRGYKETKITALKMSEDLDAGPIYMKRQLNLNGVAEEIYIRAAKIISEMIGEIVLMEPNPIPQVGEPTFFKRRIPDQSRIPEELNELNDLFDFLRMLDAEDYPLAKIRYGKFEIKFSNPVLRTKRIEAFVEITKVMEHE